MTHRMSVSIELYFVILRSLVIGNRTVDNKFSHSMNRKNINMTQEQIIEKLRGIIEPYVEDKSALQSMNGETNLLNDLDVNSANLVDIIIDVEDAFDIEIDDDSAEKMLTVKDAVEIVKTKMA